MSLPRERRQPQRSCVGCRTVRSKRELIRVVRTPTGEIQLDDTQSRKVPGRGAYLCPDPQCLTRAVRTKALERALKAPVPEEVLEELTRQLTLQPASPSDAGVTRKSR